MRYRPLGESGLVVSVAGLGCNNFGSRLDLDGTRAVVDAAIDAGITLFRSIDATVTPMGKRLLRSWLLRPSIEPAGAAIRIFSS